MKHLYWIFLPLLFIACQADEPVQPDNETGRNVICRTETRTASGAAGTVTVGRQQPSPFTVWKMQQAFVNLKARALSGAYAGDGDFISDLLEINRRGPFQASHYHIKIMPRNWEELRLLQQDTTLILFPFPLDCELDGEGVISQPAAQFDRETGTVTFTEPLTPLYACIPVYKTLPGGIRYNILHELFLPGDLDAQSAAQAGVPVLGTQMAQAMTGEAVRLTRDIDPRQPLSTWRPHGTIRVYDTKMKKYVGVPGIKVFVRENGCVQWAYTDKNGCYAMDKACYGKVTYGIKWESSDCNILNPEIQEAYYCGPTMEDDWNPVFEPNELGQHEYAYGTILRACHTYFSDANIYDHPQPEKKITLGYRHEYDPEGTAGNYGGIQRFPNIFIYGREGDANNPQNIHIESDNMLNIVFHELGHYQMHTNCIRKRLEVDSFEKEIKESWAAYIGWILLDAHYRTHGYDVNKYQAYDYGYDPKLRIQVNTRYFIKPNTYNKQQYTQRAWKDTTVKEHTYTPVFIDLVDNSNQKEYFRLFTISNNTYPDDEMVAKCDYTFLETLLYSSRNMSQLKAAVVAHKEMLSLSEEAIRNYFQFYN